MSKLIALEGLDGSGKSTTLSRLEDYYDDIVFTREPTETWYGGLVRESISMDDSDLLAELFLYTGDHANHLHNVVLPGLENNNTVVTDRYIDSRIAYQGATLQDYFGGIEEAMDFVRKIHEPWTVYPDVTIYLDISPVKAGERMAGEDNMEWVELLEDVREGYNLLIKEGERFEVVDGEQDIDDMISDVFKVMDDHVEE